MKIEYSMSFGRWDWRMKAVHDWNKRIAARVLANNGKPHIYWNRALKCYVQLNLVV